MFLAGYDIGVIVTLLMLIVATAISGPISTAYAAIALGSYTALCLLLWALKVRS